MLVLGVDLPPDRLSLCRRGEGAAVAEGGPERAPVGQFGFDPGGEGAGFGLGLGGGHAVKYGRDGMSWSPSRRRRGYS